MPRRLLIRADGLGPKEVEATLRPGRGELQMSVDDCDVLIHLVPDLDGPMVIRQDELPIIGCTRVLVEVSHDETEDIPPMDGQDFGARSEYFSQRSARYAHAARRALSRLLTYVRFRAGQPLLWGTGDEPISFSLHPSWIDEEGQEVNSGIISGDSTIIGTLGDPWHVNPLESEDETSLQSFATEVGEVPLHQTIAAQAKDAAVAGNLGRAVTELAIACEVGVKQAFFSPASAAGEAFEWLEDKGRVRVSVVELLDGPAEAAFGRSFKKVDLRRYTLLEELFRSRNKVVHRGLLEYRDAQGVRHSPDQERIRRWMDATLVLLEWLETVAGLPRLT